MPKRKNPVYLRIALVAVAVLLGLFLNLFPFRSPVWTLLTTGEWQGMVSQETQPAKQPQAEEHPAAPPVWEPGQDGQTRIFPAGDSSDAAAPAQGGSARTAPGAGNPEAVQAGTMEAGPGTEAAPARTADAAPAPEGAPPAPQDIAIVREQPKAGPAPVVVTAREQVQAAKIGRQVPTRAAATKAAPEEDKPNRVQGVTFVDTPAALEVSVVTRNPVAGHHFFHSKGPARLAVDLPGVWQGGAGASIAAKGELVERVRIGIHPDRVRLVFDYKDKDRQEFVDPVIETRPTGLFIRIGKTGKKNGGTSAGGS